jgi:hypothetical protein
MALEIEEYDPVLTRIDDPYAEGRKSMQTFTKLLK